METGEKYSWLNFVPFSSFDLWDTKRYTSKKISSSFKIVKLGTCISEESRKYKLFEEPETEFGILGVNNKEGIFDAYLERGKEINQAYKRMEIGWLAYNPYRINVGSIGIRKSKHKFEYISPAYVVFSCKENLLPEYLFLLFKTKTFNKVINESTTGSVRQNLTFEILKSLEIPLPPLSEQQKIVEAYERKINDAQELQLKAQNLEADIEKYLFEELGIEKNKISIKNDSLLHLVDFKNVQKWGFDYNNKGEDLFFHSNKYKNERLKNLVDINPTTILPDKDTFISFIPMECISDEYGKVVELREKTVLNSKGYTRFQDGDLIWARITPCMQNGKSAIVNNLKNGFGCGSTEYHVLRNSSKSVDLEFIYHILRLPKLLQYATLFFTGSAGQQRVPKAFLEDFIIPVPTLEKQKEISHHISDMKNRIEMLKNEASALKEKAEIEFEETIFKTQ